MGSGASPVVRGASIAGMLIFGTCTVVIQKIIFSLSGTGRKDGKTKNPHPFEKPWFQTEVMFIGMFGCLAVYEGMRIYKGVKARRDPASRALLGSGDTSLQVTKSKVPRWKQYVLVIIPAMCDMLATSAMNVGLLWISPSVWQMLRGSMVIFSAVFSKVFLKRELHASHWIGVATVAFALTVVAFSSLMPKVPTVPGCVEDKDNLEKTYPVVGCILVVVAQVIQASQIVVEEFLLKEVDLHAVLIVGLEGLWGGIVCSIAVVLVSFLPKWMSGEDGIDTMVMLWNNPMIMVTGLVYAIAILCYNLFGMYVTQTTSAVIRTILEGLRCACIWGVNLFIRYVVVPKKHDIHCKRYGESWTQWSYLQFCGFLFLLLGMFLYNGIVRIDGLYYAPPKKPAVAKEETAQ